MLNASIDNDQKDCLRAEISKKMNKNMPKKRNAKKNTDTTKMPNE